MNKTYNIYFYFLIVLLLAGCASQGAYKIKSFFFDGVPNPSATVIDSTYIPSTELTATLSDTLKVETVQIAKKKEPIVGSIHPPYEKRECFECHDEKNRTKGKHPLQVLCFSCHDGFKTEYPVTHGPADSGNCTKCHDPHKTGEKKLLYSIKQDLCLQCHEKSDVSGNALHAEIGETSCIDCHNPHGGNNRTFLKKEACLQCHTAITENKQYLHGPVAAGECSTCHESHDSKKEKLLLNTGTALCFNCHNTTDVLTKPYHKKVSKQNCISCHDPHGSVDPLFLKQ